MDKVPTEMGVWARLAWLSTLEKEAGRDGLLGCFGGPEAGVDGTQAAVECGLPVLSAEPVSCLDPRTGSSTLKASVAVLLICSWVAGATATCRRVFDSERLCQ